jgi:diacylglycerol kinase (ATP)
MGRPEVCVIFNPAAGKHRAGKRLEQLKKDWGSRIVFWATERPGQALELGRQAGLDGFRVVAAAGGDGTVHEVANGLLQAGRPEVHFAIVPIGSANDYAYSLEMNQPQGEGNPLVQTVDVGIVREPSGREKYFVCCLGLGFNGAVTLESRKIHRLQGMALYGWATIRALWHHYRCPPMEVQIDEEPVLKIPTLMFSILLGRREGGFVLAPDARLDDGLFDFVQAGNLSRWEVMWFLVRLALFGLPGQHSKLRQGQCRRVRVRSPEPLIVHIDGEFFARPEDKIFQVEIQIIPGVLKVQKELVL